jgi:succinate dehydrogenase / fumarate reductase flavoprotein subunit
MAKLDSKIPSGPLADKWRKHKADIKLVNPANKRKYEVIVVGAGLAGSSAAATFAELGYKVKCFVFHDSPRRAHSIAAQGGINAAKNYQNDGDSVYRLFYDTIKGGDYRAREANVHRLAEVSVNIIDQCVAQGVPFAREYGGLLANRSFGGAQVSRTFYARGQTGQQLLLGAYSALSRMVGQGLVELFTNEEMTDLVVVGGHAKGIITRDLVSGELVAARPPTPSSSPPAATATSSISRPTPGAPTSPPSGAPTSAAPAWQSRATRRSTRRASRSHRRLPVEADPDVGVAAQRRPHLGAEERRTAGRTPPASPRRIATTTSSACTRASATSRRATSLRAPPSACATKVAASARPGSACTSTSPTPSTAWARPRVRERYGNLFDIYHEITDENAYKTPMRIYPAVHYTMGGLWVDYNLMSNVPGLFVLGEANFSDHGANRLGASALMQGLADGYFVIPYTIGDYLAGQKPGSRPSPDAPEFKEAEANVRAMTQRLLGAKGTQPVSHFHKRLGQIMWNYCGMARTKEGLQKALQELPKLREEFWATVKVPGSADTLNQSLENAGRVADFIELGELMCLDALTREESCGGHFREEFQYPDGECKRDDEKFGHVAAWEFQGPGQAPLRNVEPLNYEFVKMSVRNYK